MITKKYLKCVSTVEIYVKKAGIKIDVFITDNKVRVVSVMEQIYVNIIKDEVCVNCVWELVCVYTIESNILVKIVV